MISSSPINHHSALKEMDSACKDLCLTLNPAKCVSLVIHKGQTLPKQVFHLTEGNTKSITEGLTKFLGKTMATSQYQTKRTASAILIDNRPIHGEMKLWILCHLLIPSCQFHLNVNPPQPSTIATLEKTITRYIKKWLKLPRNATLAVIYHPSLTKTPY